MDPPGTLPDPFMVLESTTDSVLILDSAWKIRYANQNAHSLLTLAPADLGVNLWQRFPQAVGGPFWQAYHRVRQTAQPESFEAYYDPLKSWFEVHAYLVGDLLVIFFRDVTERKTTQRHLEAMRNRWERMASASADILATCDRDGLLLEVSQACRRILGWEPHEITGHLFAEFLHPEDRERARAADSGVSEGRDLTGFETRFRRKDGSYADLEWSSVWIESEGRSFGVARDLSRRKADREALRHSEERYRLLFESNPQPMWVYDEETSAFLAVNHAAAVQYGYTESELLTMTVYDILAPGQADNFDRRRAATADTTRHALWRHRTKEGRTLVIEGISNAVTLFGRAARLVLAADVTAREALENQLRQSQKMEAIGQLAGGIAHDFNNLLTVINGYAQLYLMRSDLPADLRRDLGHILNSGEKAAAMTGQLLAFSRKQFMQPEILDLNDVVRGMRPLLHRLLPENIELTVHLNANPEPLHADRVQLEQLLMNLVINARDAMSKGGRLTIETTRIFLDAASGKSFGAAALGRHLVLSVSDNGEGMDPEVQSRIFEPFFTTKKRGRGTGLGLSMAYGIARQHGGHIHVYSEKGVGTTFKVYLPVAEGACLPVSTEDQTAPRSETGTETILLVEDNEGVLQFAAAVLQQRGYRVLSAKGAAEALLESENYPDQIHLLLTDVVLPRMNGRELAGYLAPLRPTTKVLFMSGYTEDAIVHHGVLDPGLEFLPKPFTAAELSASVRKALDTPARVRSVIILELSSEPAPAFVEALASSGYHVRSVLAAEARGRVSELQPVDLVVLNLVGQGEEAIALIQDLREGLPHAKLLAISGPQIGSAHRQSAEVLGVSRILTAPVSPSQLVEQIRTLIG